VRRLSLYLILATFALLAAAPAASAHAITMTKSEKQLMTLVNHVRAKHHLHQLTMVRSLDRKSTRLNSSHLIV
jgi:predicted porin